MLNSFVESLKSSKLIKNYLHVPSVGWRNLEHTNMLQVTLEVLIKLNFEITYFVHIVRMKHVLLETCQYIFSVNTEGLKKTLKIFVGKSTLL